MSNTGRITCGRCHTEFEIEVPSLAVLNGPEACVVVAHPKPVACPGPGCSATYQPIIQQVQAAFQFPEVHPKSNGSGLIVPGVSPATLRRIQ